jgi:GDSL-like Lipase/Acylhydrolase family
MVKGVLAKGGLMLLSICFTLGAFDLAVYLIPKHLLPDPLRNLISVMQIRSGTHRVRDPELGYMIRPGTDFFFPGEEFRFRFQTRLNFPNAGFRGGTLGGPVWGAAFGDSFTFGAGVDQAKSWVGQLAGLTKREIINFGTPGQGPHQYTRIFRRYGAPLRPKIVFYGLFTNDLKDGVRFEDRQAHPEKPERFSAKQFMRRYSASYNLLGTLFSKLKRMGKKDTRNGIGLKLLERSLRSPYGVSESRFASAWTAVAREIEDAVEESKRINATFVLLYFPSKEEVYWELTKDKIKEIERFKERIERLRKVTIAFCVSRDLWCLDLTPALKTRGLRGEMLYYPVDIHWNGEGNTVAAQEIYKFLVAKNLIE